MPAFSLAAGSTAAEGASDAADVQLEIFEQTREDFAPFLETGTAALDLLSQIFLGTAPENPDAKSFEKKLKRLDQELQAAIQPVPTGRREAGQLIQEDFATGGGRGRSVDEINADIRRVEAEFAASNAAVQPTDPSELFKTPGFDFRVDEGVKARDRSAASRGLLLSGSQLQAQEEFGQNIASAEFNNFVNELNVLAGFGSTAAGQTGAIGVQTGSNVGSSLTTESNARASGVLGAGQSIFDVAGLGIAGSFF